MKGHILLLHSKRILNDLVEAYEIKELSRTPEMKERIAECKAKYYKNRNIRNKVVLAVGLIVVITIVVFVTVVSIQSLWGNGKGT